MTQPILYSFRRCPYAMRARLALIHCGAQYETREILLKDKPSSMLEASKKGTVPVLVLADHRVIDESIDIMRWAMTENSERHLENASQWLNSDVLSTDEVNALINTNDFEFKGYLDKYKYSDRHPEHPQEFYLNQAMPFLETLETLLDENTFLGGSEFRFVDAAILPFIRQFSMVDTKQFSLLPLPNLKRWLDKGLSSELFIRVMEKRPQWKPEP